jgi:hypothetical protein
MFRDSDPDVLEGEVALRRDRRAREILVDALDAEDPAELTWHSAAQGRARVRLVSRRPAAEQSWRFLKARFTGGDPGRRSVGAQVPVPAHEGRMACRLLRAAGVG